MTIPKKVSTFKQKNFWRDVLEQGHMAILICFPLVIKVTNLKCTIQRENSTYLLLLIFFFTFLVYQRNVFHYKIKIKASLKSYQVFKLSMYIVLLLLLLLLLYYHYCKV